MVSALLHPAGPLASRRVGWRPPTGSRAVAGPSNGARVFARAGNWLPGSPPRPWLPDDMVGNYGYDPLGLGKNASNLKQFQRGEIMNARWAMLGVAGMFGAEFLGQGDWVEAPLWAVKGEQAQYLGRTIPLNLKSLAVIELILVGGAEGLRLTDTDETRRIYPGGLFDPFGLSKDPEQFEDLKLKELQNGRLAMFAFVGFVSQYIATGKGPVANLYDHIADPWGTNFATNGYSLPF